MVITVDSETLVGRELLVVGRVTTLLTHMTRSITPGGPASERRKNMLCAIAINPMGYHFPNFRRFGFRLVPVDVSSAEDPPFHHSLVGLGCWTPSSDCFFCSVLSRSPSTCAERIASRLRHQSMCALSSSLSVNGRVHNGHSLTVVVVAAAAAIVDVDSSSSGGVFGLRLAVTASETCHSESETPTFRADPVGADGQDADEMMSDAGGMNGLGGGGYALVEERGSSELAVGSSSSPSESEAL